MTDVKGYDPNVNWLNQVNDDSSIDYFFTQRKISEVDELIDEKTLERKKIKKNKIYNFLAINFPHNQFKNSTNLCIDIEMWGDKNYNYKGLFKIEEGILPHLMVKLNDDTQIFVKLVYKSDNNILKKFTIFIPILKRYQFIPEKTE